MANGAELQLSAPAPVTGLAERSFAYRHPDGGRLVCRFPVLTVEAMAALQDAQLPVRRRLLDLSFARRSRWLAGLLEACLDPEQAAGALARRWLPVITGYSAPVIAAGLDDLGDRVNHESLALLVQASLGREAAGPGSRRVPFGPPWSLHVCAGNVPGVGLFSAAVALLAGAPSVVKVARGQPLLPLLCQQELQRRDPELAHALWPVYWHRAELAGPAGTLAAATPALIAFGNDDAVAAYRALVNPRCRFIPHGERFSIAVLGDRWPRGQEATGRSSALAGLARDVALFDQQGCLSPQVLYVLGGTGAAQQAGRDLQQALARVAESLPPGAVPAGPLGTIRQLVETRRFLLDDGLVLGRPGRDLVLYDPDPAFRLSPLYRTVWVQPVARLEELRAALGHAFRRVASIGVAGLSAAEVERLVHLAGAQGVGRITACGRMQRPPATWHHDGRLELADLLEWCEEDALTGPGGTWAGAPDDGAAGA